MVYIQDMRGLSLAVLAIERDAVFLCDSFPHGLVIHRCPLAGTRVPLAEAVRLFL